MFGVLKEFKALEVFLAELIRLSEICYSTISYLAPEASEGKSYRISYTVAQ